MSMSKYHNIMQFYLFLIMYNIYINYYIFIKCKILNMYNSLYWSTEKVEFSIKILRHLRNNCIKFDDYIRNHNVYNYTTIL